MRTTYPSIQKFCVLLLVLSCLLRGLTLYKTHPRPPERSNGWLTPQQIMTKSAAICHVVAPQFDAVNIAIEPSSFSGDAHQFVVCTNPAGQELVHLLWDARTGQIVDIGCSSICHTWYPNMKMAVVSKPKQAVASAASWIHLLNLTYPGNQWHLAEPPTLGYNHHWGVCCKSGKQRLYLYIDGYCGSLIAAFLS